MAASQADWGEMTLTWNNKPATDQFVDYFSVTTTGWRSMDITSIFTNWYNGSVNNYGLNIEPEMFNWALAGAGIFWSREHGSNEPYIKVDYTLEQRPLWTGPYNALQII